MLLRLFALLIIVFLPLSASGQSAEDAGKLTTKYDRFTDETTVETDLIRLWGTAYDHLEVSFGVLYKGAAPKKPKIAAIFKQIFKDTGVIEAKQIYVIADGERLVINDVSRLLLKNALPGTSVYRHEFFALFGFDVALKLAKSKRVEMRIGHVEVALQSAQQSALMGLLKRFE